MVPLTSPEMPAIALVFVEDSPGWEVRASLTATVMYGIAMTQISSREV